MEVFDDILGATPNCQDIEFQIRHFARDAKRAELRDELKDIRHIDDLMSYDMYLPIKEI
jgi:hypothetical protein